MTVVLITDDNQVFTANVGDSLAMLVMLDKKIKKEVLKLKEKGEEVDKTEYSHVYLTIDHKPCLPKESKRIYRSGGEVRPSKSNTLTQRSKSSERPNFITKGRQRVWAKGKDVPGLAISRTVGDEIAHSVGVSAEPGNIIHY